MNIDKVTLPLLALILMAGTGLAEKKISGDWTYTVKKGEATIVGYQGSETEVAVPAELDGIPVKHIGQMVFASNRAEREAKPFTKIVIPEGIASIDAGAFFMCAAITEITIPETVTKIGESAFAGTGLSNIAIPAGLTNVHRGAFFDCLQLTNISVDPANPQYASADGVLFEKDRKTLLEYPEGKAGDYAVPDGVTTIAKFAFSGHTKLTSITIPASVAKVEKSEFSRCTGLTNVVLPDAPSADVASLEFPEKEPMTSGDWLYTVDKAGDATIAGYTGESVKISVPNKLEGHDVKTIGAFSLWSCGGRKNSFTEIIIPEGIETIENEGCSFGKMTGIVIPASMKIIGGHAFGRTELTNVFIPKGVLKIGDGAFAACKNLANISVDPLNPSYSSVDGVLFDKGTKTLLQYPCGKSGKYVIPNGVTAILASNFEAGFEQCDKLTAITIPNGITNGIKAGAFRGCTRLTSITVDPKHPGFTSVDGVLFDKNRKQLVQFPPGKAGNYKVPEGVTNIPEDAFRDAGLLTSAVLPEGVQSIGANAFSECASLTNVVIPESVTQIGQWAFIRANSLKNVSIPASVVGLEKWAFIHCSSLTNISVSPENPKYTSVDGVLFDKERKTLLQYPAGKAGGYSVPDGVETIAEGAFGGATNLTSIIIPPSVANVDDGEFSDCTGLTNVVLPKTAREAIASLEFPEKLRTRPKSEGEQGGAGVFPMSHSLTVGKVTYQNVTLKNVYPQSVLIKHDRGTAFIDRKDLRQEQLDALQAAKSTPQ